MIPGIGETVRVRGTATISTAEELRARFAVSRVLPATVLVVHVERVYFQCQRALVRSHLWDPDRYVDRGALPSAGQLQAEAGAMTLSRPSSTTRSSRSTAARCCTTGRANPDPPRIRVDTSTGAHETPCVVSRSLDAAPDRVEPAGPLVARGAARWRAIIVDWLVIVGWIALLSGAVAVLRLLVPGVVFPSTALAVDGIAFAASVLPAWIYLTVCESGTAQATWGKRLAGLQVVSLRNAQKPGAARIAGRNAVKLLPWQLAHLAVARLILDVNAPLFIAVTYSLSLIIACGSVAMAWRDGQHRALHDRVAGTQVVQANAR